MSPITSVGNLYMNSGTRGSGVLVGPNDLLTALHVAVDEAGAFPGGQVYFDSGAVTARLVGVAHLDVPALWQSEYISLGDIRYDLALVTLDQPIGETLGWMDIDSIERPVTLQVAGYPSAPWDGRTLATETVTPLYDELLGVSQFASSTVHPGSSGGPVYEVEADGSAELAGLVSARSQDGATAYSSLITPTMLGSLERWIAANDPVTASSMAGVDEAFLARPVHPAGASPESLAQIRDYDGNDLGADASWRLGGAVDVNANGDADWLFVNATLGRWATVAPDASGRIDFSDYGAGGETRVVGIYLDPLVASGDVEAGSPFDSQQRLREDLHTDTLELVAGFDFDADGFQEIYFRETNGDAYLRALMHADGNVQYANYQNEQQVEDYLSGLGYGSDVIDIIIA